MTYSYEFYKKAEELGKALKLSDKPYRIRRHRNVLNGDYTVKWYVDKEVPYCTNDPYHSYGFRAPPDDAWDKEPIVELQWVTIGPYLNGESVKHFDTREDAIAWLKMYVEPDPEDEYFSVDDLRFI